MRHSSGPLTHQRRTVRPSAVRHRHDARSARAVKNLRAICDEYLEGRYDLEVIDIYQQPVLAKGEQIIAAPTLIKKLPLPMRRIIGDMSNRERVLLGLDLVRSPTERGR